MRRYTVDMVIFVKNTKRHQLACFWPEFRVSSDAVNRIKHTNLGVSVGSVVCRFL